MVEFRIDKDTMGDVEVPIERCWGPQTQRSLTNFKIGEEKMPRPLIYALGMIKCAAAEVNAELGLLPKEIAGAIAQAAREIAEGEHDDEFPLSVWQTGSGTQTNMNANEVIANLANRTFGHPYGTYRPVHPNDHCNLGQSSNDTFPTAMHLALVLQCHQRLFPVLERFEHTLGQKVEAFRDVIKIGRTHLQDATPMTLGQEFSGYLAQIASSKLRLIDALRPLYGIAQGGTAVGTGLNAHHMFSEAIAQKLAQMTGLPIVTAPNKFEALASHDSIVSFHGVLTSLATALFKIAQDLRFLASGPRSGIGELLLPENEPGSSIMPGKVNPTQCEALTMVCVQVMGNNTTVSIAGSQGNFELNVFKPLIVNATYQSIRLLSDAMESFQEHCLMGVQANFERIKDLVDRSLMLVTGLTPKIGYEKAAMIAKHAHTHGTTLKEAAVRIGGLSEEEYARYVQPEKMVHPLD